MQNQATLWSPPDLSGWLHKRKGQVTSRKDKRWFCLKGSYLFYFRDAGAAKCQGVIPLEGAAVEAAHGGKGAGEPRIRITLEPDPGLRHTSYVLATDGEDMQAVWLALLMHAAIPRSELVLELQDVGRLEQLLGQRSAATRATTAAAAARVSLAVGLQHVRGGGAAGPAGASDEAGAR
ncbi:hypothetical protein WJX81_006127 [Elliptochloris bilobata]|uniref:PH domain-containing protein n=1 Tax=Elliptochloris bilobata TaxID=381761 RepID=A0AAW1QZ33_9CHLO